MTKIYTIASGCLLTLLTFPITSSAQWVHTYGTETDKQVIHTAEIKDGVTLTFPDATADGSETLSITPSEGDVYTLAIENINRIATGGNIPTIRLTMDDPVIADKTTWHPGTFMMDGQGGYDDVAVVDVNVRGRGNSTFWYPKKPMRIKFESKLSIAGLKKAKNYILLANFVDETLMKNAFAFRIGQLIGLPFTHHMIPVNVEVNGESWGQYNLTEKRGINGASVDIDETTGILIELAQTESVDETYSFETGIEGLSAMVSDPDFDELYGDAESAEAGSGIQPTERLKAWESDFRRITDLYSATTIRPTT